MAASRSITIPPSGRMTTILTHYCQEGEEGI
jgi:hypothetical protein